MTLSMLRRGRLQLAAMTIGLTLAVGTTAAGAGQHPALAAAGNPGADPSELITLADSPAHVGDLDKRGVALPTAVQRRAAAALGASVRWNSFGTPASLLPADGSLGRATSSDPVRAARAWLRSNRAVLGLSSAQVEGLQLVNSQRFAQSSARAVLFRQRFGSLSPAIGSMVTVGVANGRIAYVSSSLTRTTSTPAAPVLDSRTAWLRAAADVKVPATLADITGFVANKLGWDRFRVAGLAQEQQVRLRALALADGSVRPAYVANVTDVAGAKALSHTVIVDAVDGAVLHRTSNVDHSDDAFPVTGEVKKASCGAKTRFTITDNETKSITFVATTAVAALNDIELKLYGPGDVLLATEDVGTSPEAMVYSAPLIPQGDYAVTVCDFGPSSVSPLFVDSPYAGVVITSNTAAPSSNLPSPRWRYFTANPDLNESTTHVPTNRIVGCWTSGPGCTTPVSPIRNLASRGPWDVDQRLGLPTFTTLGNNAATREAWLSPLTPGGLLQAPVSAARNYSPAFTDAWQNSRCDPLQIRPGGNDIDASVANLFVAHNRMHDYSYFLGFTEANYNLQSKNFGANTDPSRENDPEIGNVQAGAVGGLQTGLGRDNANQITLQDGIAPITNQYLFQPIAGAFYSPCTDGSLDMSIVGHEYTHAISNRMVGGPDEGLTSEQGGAMGESWSDLVAAEYLISHGYSTGTNPWAVGPYATGNRVAGIRDYAINKNPLNYSDYGFDSTGDEVHADGEIWNGTMYDVRQALVKKYNGSFPATNRALQLRCAQGTATRSPLPATQCPGNRRWIQLVFDSFLLQQGSTSMLDARDAMLAADRMRFKGANQAVMWNAFAKRGMGAGARTPSADSGDVKPSFASPKARNGVITFTSGARGKLYVGRYEARVTPVADTVPSTALGSAVRFAPGRYQLLFQAPGRGFKRFAVTVRPGERRTVRIAAPVNLASRSAGAKVLRATPGSLNAEWLIDDTEATNWAGVTTGTDVDSSRPYVAVDLAGGVRTVKRVQVSAMLRPAPASPTDLPLLAGADDPDSGSRFTAVRRFAVERCVSSCASASARWIRFYTSPANAFPAIRPRPVAPNLILRSFDVPDVRAAALRFVVLENQCTGFTGFAGDQDSDPTNDTDCKSGSDRGQSARAAEFQVY